MSELSDIPQAEPSVVAIEMVRRQTLEAMGIDVYVSRCDMPGAAPSVRQRFTPIEAPSAASPSISTSSHDVGGRKAASSSRAGSAIKDEGATPTPRSASPQSEKAAEKVKFSMLLVSAGPFLWVEQLADGLIRQDQLALINAMARALRPEVSVRQQQFDWPMRGGTALSGDAESAKQALQGLIQRMAREVDAKRVVVMGSCPFLPDRIAQSAVVIPSTIAMLQNAGLKREAWQALKPLRAIELASN